MNKKERFSLIWPLLKQEYPDAWCELRHKNAYELLIATILSAQCTDKRVNIVTKDLFAKYPTVRDLAEANVTEVEEIIKSTGFYRNKAKNIVLTAQIIVDDYDGRVPDNMEQLLTLAGVARKTANVVLGTWYKKTTGIVVDTHVKRLSNRMGFTKQSNPDKVEQDLCKLVPKEEWIMFSHVMIFHGRALCDAKKPLCTQCPLREVCPSVKKYL
jgi:endonuclease-3